MIRIKKVYLFCPLNLDVGPVYDGDFIELESPIRLVEKGIIPCEEFYYEFLKSIGINDEIFPSEIYEILETSEEVFFSVISDVYGVLNYLVPAQICVIYQNI